MRDSFLVGTCLFGGSLLINVLTCILFFSCVDHASPEKGPVEMNAYYRPDIRDAEAALPRTEEEWKSVLTPEQYRVARMKGTEPAFTGEYHDMKKKGTYHCVCCGQPLFSSEAKFDSGTGWPSYYEPIEPENVKLAPDTSLGIARIEALCSRCDAHLGHVFDDGPPPTGKRYCINSVSLKLEESESTR